MLQKAILQKIEERFGNKIIMSAQCAEVAEDIYRVTKDMVAETSVQRWFGLTSDHDRKQRPFTLAIIAKYCGYASWDLLLADVGGADCDISRFSDIEEFYSDEINAGTQVKVTWEPGRMLLMTYLVDNQYIVNEVAGSRNLQIGDKLTIPHMAVGFPMLVSEVLREGHEPTPYQAGLVGGLTSIVELVPERDV